jgi:hypothetical protein
LNGLVTGIFLLPGRRLGQKIKFRFSKLKIVTQRHRQRNNAIQQPRLFQSSTEAAHERN